MHKHIFMIIVAAVLSSAVSVDAAIIYNWSFVDVDQGGNNLIEGTLELDDACAAKCTNTQALSVVLTSAYFGPIGIDFTEQIFGQFFNSFSTIGGTVTAANFFAAVDLIDEVNASLILCVGCASSYQSLQAGEAHASDGFAAGIGDGSSLTITRVVPVPLPGALLLFVSALAGLRATSQPRSD